MFIHTEVKRYLEWLSDVREAQQWTVACYSATLHKLVSYVGDRDITPELLEEFCSRPRKGGITPKPATRNRDAYAIRAFYDWAKKRGLTDSDPSLDIGIATVHNRLPKAIEDDVWLHVWDRGMLDEDRAWLGLGFYAGLRREEIATINARLFCVDRKQMVGFVRKGGGVDELDYGAMAQVQVDHLPKVGVRVHEWFECVAWLAASRRDDQFLMPQSGASANPINDPSWINSRLKRVLRESGLPEDTFTPHALRHSCGTNLVRCGLPIEVVADLLSHSSIETTRRYLDSGMILRSWREQRRLSH